MSCSSLSTSPSSTPLSSLLPSLLQKYLSPSVSLPSHLTGCQIDSRLIAPGNLFFALSGAQTDGHLHLEQAALLGGIAAVVSSSYKGPDFGLVLIRVEDVLQTLQALAAQSLLFSSPHPRPLIVGITGSVGKTTVKEFLAHFLGARFRVFKTPASYNTKRTLPLSLLNRKGDEEFLILEMGMSEPGELDQLTQIAPPDLAVVTQVGLVHAAFFPGGVEQIAQEKGRIFSHPRTKTAVFPYRFSTDTSSKRVSFSTEEREADYFLSQSGELDEKGVRAYRFDLPFTESHLRYNFLLAAAVARELGMEWDEIQAQVPTLQGARMRFEKFKRGGVHFINDAYNANPMSMKAALLNLPTPQGPGKRIAILGSMKELGSFSEAAHRDIGVLARQFVDHLLLLGEETLPLAQAFAESKKPTESFLDHSILANRLKELIQPGDVVLVKGSRSLQLEKLFELL